MDGRPAELPVLLWTVAPLNFWLLASSISVAGWSLSINWAAVFPVLSGLSLLTGWLASSFAVLHWIFILGLTDPLNHNSYEVLKVS